jgi:hypothetical protein
MLANWIRLFLSDNGVLSDISLAAQNSDNINFQLVSTEDYLYCGQYYPFNNLYFELLTANSNAASLHVQYWDGKVWADGLDVIDATKVSGVTLARNGVVQFSPNRERRWQVVRDPTQNQGPSELITLPIYDLYWIRIKASADLSACVLKNISYAFCTSAMLKAIDSEIDNYLMAWGGVGKTNWDEQVLLASQYVVFDLKSKGFIVAPGNILRFEDVSLATAHRTLAVIYSQLGESFRDKLTASINMYGELMSIKRFNFDSNDNALLESQEISNTVGKLVR